MKLPKWVVKWVKDDFNVEKLELKVKQQEEEIKKLKKEIVSLRREKLPEDERRWALIAYWLLARKNFDIELKFKEDYLEEADFLSVLDDIASINENELPFN